MQIDLNGCSTYNLGCIVSISESNAKIIPNFLLKTEDWEFFFLRILPKHGLGRKCVLPLKYALLPCQIPPPPIREVGVLRPFSDVVQKALDVWVGVLGQPEEDIGSGAGVAYDFFPVELAGAAGGQGFGENGDDLFADAVVTQHGKRSGRDSVLNSLFYPEWNGARKISQRHGVKINVRSLALALKLEEHHCGTVDYAIVWDQPHCDADYPNEVCRWIQKITET